jgi:DEAD/DEAH box helicase domain-containing protein
MLTGKDFELVSHSGAPQGKRNFIFINPPKDGQSAYIVATKLFTESVRSGFKAIAFTKARKATELMHSWVKQSDPDIAERISSYRAGLLPQERREVEKRLFSGELGGVISTSALELGVDIGGLDVCILTGYPGTISSTRQRSGRVGRSGQDSLIVMIGLNDALDQYFMHKPQEFFKRPPEAAVLDSLNKPITKAHLQCAISEAYLKPDDKFYDSTELKPILQELEVEGKLRHWEKGAIWYPATRFPHREVSIRGMGKNYKILDKTGKVIGESDASRIFKELYPGAIYMHRGIEWRVESLDTGNCEVICRPSVDANYYTRPITNEEVEIISIDAAIEIDGVGVNLGMIKVTESVSGYRKKEKYTNRLIGEFTLNLPPSVFTTSGVWMGVNDAILAEVRKMNYDDNGALHALEHAMITCLPLFALCDRMDLGGRSYPYFHELGSAGIFVYDGHEGGVGLARRGFECIKDWLVATQTIMEECPCEVSCPSCTQDPNCGNNNDPLDKRGALFILKDWLTAK